jgi:hypothetical protein
MRHLIAVIAIVALALLDYVIVSAAFLYTPTPAEWLLALVAVGAAASGWWRRGLPLFVAQNLLLVVTAGHALGAGSPLDTQGAIMLALSFLTGNGLVWLAARGLVPRAASPVTPA